VSIIHRDLSTSATAIEVVSHTTKINKRKEPVH